MIELERVSLAGSDGRPLLDAVTLRIPAGESVALMGAPEGLAGRLLEPDSGRMLIDGREATRYEVVAAAKAAGAHAFAAEPPEHYDTRRSGGSASGSRRASASGWRSPARCCATRGSS